MRKDIFERILELRDELYEDTLGDVNDRHLVEHLKREYKNCDTDALADEIVDKLLDSFGS